MKHIAIINGTIIDGTSALPIKGDLVFAEEKITEIGQNLDLPAQIPRIDVAGSIICPGFIDAHSHSDVSLLVNGALSNAEIPDNIRITMHYPEKIPYVRGNRFIVEAFLEIIMNAVEAMEGRPRKVLTIRVSCDVNHVQVDFTDTGVGIEASRQEKAFELFQSDRGKASEGHFGFPA